LGTSLPHPLPPIGPHLLGQRIVAQDLHALFGQSPQVVGVGDGRTAEAGFELPIVEGAHGVLADADHRLGNVLRHPGIEDRDQRVHIRQRVRVDDDLRVRRVGVFGRDRQIEPRRPLADERADAGDRGLLLQHPLDLLQVFRNLLDPHALRRPVIDHDLAAAAVGEEQLRHEAETVARHDKQNHQTAQEGDPPADRPAQQAAKAAEKGRLIDIGLFLARLGRRQPAQGQHRRDRLAEDPTEQQRNRHDREQAARVLARAVGRREDGIEGHAGDDRRAQQGDRRLAGRFDRRPLAVHALSEPHDDPVDHDDGVVDHHPHRDDQRAQRNSLQIDAHHPHHDETGQDRKDQAADADDQADAKAHRHGDDHEHDRHGLQQVGDEGVDGFADRIRLPRDLLDADPDRQFFDQFGQSRIDGSADMHHVLAGPGRDRHGDGRHAVLPEQAGAADRRSRTTRWRNRGCG
jgi:hypothetical protein